MIKVYLKRPVCVERIDELGTGLLDKYEIYSLSGGMWHPHDEVGHSMLCSGYLEWGDWIATGADGSHWIIQNALYEQQYGELPVISKELDTYIQLYKRNGYGITDMLYDLNDEVCPDVHLTKDDIARAWLDGYQVGEQA
ncbi:hypothetical protein [Lactiplantibacillus plantarum]|uniref:Prophage Lp1 protein 31 n=3 Tax=Lactiplantibacillus plantarum TaxID=1590 RepID=A0AAW3RH47_LACPN|nr:hypothetical protein [Lactiplantibacillus plantarum]AOB20767.1 hypothetical protein AVR82_14525 [Lactiplantibacillus plantarum]AOB21436.1 hypothetical protein AVR83_00120 [Lactiplantibacillus plantarum]AOB24422.1 hypothetical protein AVR83_16340 [Lactiplantibacillus plantarum]ASZ33101.1 hypothetical protein CLC99_07425 [Lactiplantibacillus plantarum]KPN44393.1 prophage Lp1 protein 31 [Lactiplantibacillus plantarum WJL]